VLLTSLYLAFCSFAFVRLLVRAVLPRVAAFGEMTAFFLWPYPFLLSVQKWWPTTNAGWWAAYALGMCLVFAFGCILQARWGASEGSRWKIYGLSIWLWYAPLLMLQVFTYGVAAALGWPRAE
jgi:hypothetical protein